MGALVWSFLLRKVLSGLPGLSSVRARWGGTGCAVAVPTLQVFPCLSPHSRFWGGCPTLQALGPHTPGFPVAVPHSRLCCGCPHTPVFSVAVPTLQAVLCWWRCSSRAHVGAVGGMVLHSPERREGERSRPVPSRAAVRGRRCHSVLPVCCSFLPAGLGGAARGPRGHPASPKCGKTPQLSVGACQPHRGSGG